MAEAEEVHNTEDNEHGDEQQQEAEQVDQHQEEPSKDGEATAVEQAAAQDQASSPTAAAAEPAKEASEQNLVAAAEEDAVVHEAAPAQVQHTAPAQVVQEADQEQQQQDDKQAAGQEQYVHVQHNASPTHVQESKRGAQSVAASHCGPFSQTAADGRLLSFSAPPYVPKAKPYRRVDYSHSSVQLMKIAHDNQLLVNHLTTISKAVPAWTKDASAPPAPGNTASSAVNRRKAATVIAQENHALYQRLVAIRPSKDISRETLEAGHRQNELYRTNCAQFKSLGSPKGKAVPASP